MSILKMDKDTILSERRDIFMNSLKGMLIMLFKENSQPRQNYLKRRENWTEEIWNKEMLILPSMKPIENSNL